MKKEYSTQRLTLKTLNPNSAHTVLDFYDRNRGWLEPWEPTREPYFYTLPTQKRNLSLDLKAMKELSLLRLWLFKHDDTHFEKTIGTISFSSIQRGAFWSCFLGYKIDKTEACQGYMTEALQKAIDIIFNEYELHRIEANIMPSNTPSMKLIEKLGFENEGLAKSYLHIAGKWEDHIHMVKLNRRV